MNSLDNKQLMRSGIGTTIAIRIFWFKFKCLIFFVVVVAIAVAGSSEPGATPVPLQRPAADCQGALIGQLQAEG